MKIKFLFLIVNILSVPAVPRIFDCLGCFQSVQREAAREAAKEAVIESRRLAKLPSDRATASFNAKLAEELAQKIAHTPSRK